MEINITTPALLFPALSLLMLAYTNRFLGLASRIRALHATYRTEPEENVRLQIENLRYRVVLIQNMQAFAVGSIFLCVLTMLVIVAGYNTFARAIFVVSLVGLLISLALSLREIQLSVYALNLQLSDVERHEDAK